MELTQLRRLHQAEQSNIAMVKKENAQFAEQIRQQQAQQGSLADAATQNAKQCTELSEELQDWKTRCAELSEQLVSAQTELGETRKEGNSSAAVHETTVVRCTELEESLRAAESAADEMRMREETITEDNAKLTKLCEVLSERSKEYETELLSTKELLSTLTIQDDFVQHFEQLNTAVERAQTRGLEEDRCLHGMICRCMLFTMLWLP